MGANSNIAWTDHTYNPWRGCTNVGPGCAHCYAEARDLRYESGKNATSAAHWGPGAARIRAVEHTLNAPLRWARQAAATGKRKVFCLSLGDLLDEEVDPRWRAETFDVARRTPNLRWQFVSKRIGFADAMLPSGWSYSWKHCGFIATVVNQDEADRDIPKLVAAKRMFGVTWVGLSIEPQLGPIDLSRHLREGVDWVISGGESRQPQQTPRPYDLAWARSLRDQCSAAGVAYFQKQLGARPIDSDGASFAGHLTFEDRQAGADPSEWPADLRVREFPEALL